MQTVYLGNTLINDVMIGSNRMSDVFNVSPTIVTASLVSYWDASYSASAANWRNVLPFTGSDAAATRTGSLTQTSYTSTYPASFNLTGSLADINFQATPTLLQTTGPYTLLLYLKPVNDTGNTNLLWYGSVSNQRVELQMSGSIGGNKFLRIVTETSSSVATDCVVSLNDYHQICLTTDGTANYSGFNLWVDSTKQAISGSTAWSQTSTNFHIIGTINSARPLSGSVGAYMIYNRKLSDNEILQNLRYFRARTGFF